MTSNNQCQTDKDLLIKKPNLGNQHISKTQVLNLIETPDCDKWKGFGADPSSSEKNVDKVDKNGEKILREQQICLSLVGVLLVVCLILYGVLLHFAVKASSC